MVISPHRLLWVTDPWETLDYCCDTTLRLIQEAWKMGITNYWCDVKTIRFENDRYLLDARRVIRVGEKRLSGDFRLGAPSAMSPGSFSHIFYRTDPPVDLAYLHPLQMLCSAIRGSSQSKTEIVNNPTTLLAGSEKLEGAPLRRLMPATVASGEWEVLRRFGVKEKRTVLKPLHQAQSKGVELLDWTRRGGLAHAKEALSAATDGFQRPALLQRYLPGILEHGELRLWLLDGKLLAAATKVPKKGHFKIDMDAGGRLAPAVLSAKERSAAREIGAHLKRLDVRWAAVDLIDGYITDFNFTSPGLLVEMEQVTRRNLAREIIGAVGRR